MVVAFRPRSAPHGCTTLNFGAVSDEDVQRRPLPIGPDRSGRYARDPRMRRARSHRRTPVGEAGAKRRISGIVFGGGLSLFAGQFLTWLF